MITTQEIEKITKQNTILRTALILCFVIILVLIGIVLLPDKDVQSPENAITSGEMILIETPYCTLEYPEEASELLKSIDKNENDTYSKVFYADIDGQDIELFEISFGAKDNAVLIGYIMHNDTKYPVFVRSSEIDNTLSQDSQNTVYMMQEGINDVIHSITSNENYLEE